MTASDPQQVSILKIDQLQANPLQPRGKIKKEDLDELVQSIKAYGILEPIIVAHTLAGYQIIAGERRWRAAKVAGLTEVPVLVKKTNSRGMLEMAIIENVQRVDLSPIERAQAFLQLARDFKFSIGQIAEKIGKSASYVSNSLKLLELPDAIKDGLMGEQISEGHARAISGIEDKRAMIDCYKVILKENASVRRAEELARRFKEQIGQVQNAVKTTSRIMSSPMLDRWQADLQNVFSDRAKVKLVQSRKQTRVTITFSGSPEEAQDGIERLLKLSEI